MQLKKFVFLLGFITFLATPGAGASPGDSSQNFTGATALPGDGAFRYLHNLAGVYTGTVNSAGITIPMITEFFVGKDGHVFGAYKMTEASGIVEGELYEFRAEDSHTLTATWKDKYGSGLLRMRFTNNGREFKGLWGPDTQHAIMRWDGTKK